MGSNRKKTAFAIFALAFFVSVCLFFLCWENTEDRIKGTLHVEAGCSSLYIAEYDLILQGWEKYGVTYFFIPSYAIVESIEQDDPTSKGRIYCKDGSLLKDPQYGEIQEVDVDLGSEGVTPWKIAFFHSSGLYTAYINLNGADVYSIEHDEYMPSTLMLYTPEGKLEYQEDELLIKGRGNSTWNTEKQPYEFKLSENYPLCGLKSSSKWALLANFYDDTKILNKMIMDLSADMGMPYAIDSDWIDLYINGEYRGNYLLSKDPGIGKGRLELADGCFIEKTTQVDVHNDEYSFWVNNDYFRVKDPAPVSKADFQNIRKLVEETDEDIRYGDTDRQLEHIDVPSFSARAMIDEFSYRLASMELNCYFYNIGDKLYAGPCWDYDLAGGNPDIETYYEGYDGYLRDYLADDALKWDSLLLENLEYKGYYDKLFAEAEPIMMDVIETRIDRYAEKIRDSLAMDHEVWYGAEPHIRFYDNRENQYRYLKFFLYQRVKLLAMECNYNKPLKDPALGNGSVHSVTCNQDDDTPVVLTYKDGELILPEDLPEYDETVYSGWMLDREEGELLPYIPVYEDLVLKLKPLG